VEDTSTRPGYQLKVDLEALNRCSYTFSRNAQELTAVGRTANGHPPPLRRESPLTPQIVRVLPPSMRYSAPVR
jgi:hypothetical protein